MWLATYLGQTCGFKLMERVTKIIENNLIHPKLSKQAFQTAFPAWAYVGLIALSGMTARWAPAQHCLVCSASSSAPGPGRGMHGRRLKGYCCMLHFPTASGCFSAPLHIHGCATKLHWEKRQTSGKGLQQQHKLCNDSGKSELAVFQSEMQGLLLIDCFSQ